MTEPSVTDTRPLVMREAGPVTLSIRVATRQYRNRWKLLARAWPALFALFLIAPAAHGTIARYADGVLGYDATLCLIACLSVTPFLTVARARITWARRWYGVWTFVLGAAGLTVHLASPPGSIGERAAGSAVNWTGLLTVALLLPLTATSTAAAQRVLGPEWKRWQRALVWAVWLIVGCHFAVLHAWLVLCAYAACSLPAVLLRDPRVRKSVREWRGTGYSGGRWWVTLAVLGSVTVAGLSVLLTEEAEAIARALTGS